MLGKSDKKVFQKWFISRYSESPYKRVSEWTFYQAVPDIFIFSAPKKELF